MGTWRLEAIALEWERLAPALRVPNWAMLTVSASIFYLDVLQVEVIILMKPLLLEAIFKVIIFVWKDWCG